MHRLLCTLSLLATLALPLGDTAVAGTPQQTFEKLIDKVAPGDLFSQFKPRFACACFEQSPPGGGVLTQDGSGRIRCGLPSFFPSGELAGIFYCSNYEILGR